MPGILFLVIAGMFGIMKAQPQSAPTPPSQAPEPIPLAQIAEREEELSRTLRDISRRLPSESEIELFEQQLLKREESVQAGIQESLESLAASATIMEIREQAREWAAFNAPEARDRKTLSAWAERCEESSATLGKHLAVWLATQNNIRSGEEIDPVLARIHKATAEINSVREMAEERLHWVVDLQGRVSKQALAIADILEKLDEASQRFQRRFLYPDARPLWRAATEKGSAEPAGKLLNRSVARSYSSSAAFVREKPWRIAVMIVLLTISFGAFRWFSRATLKQNSSDPVIAKAERILKRPLALAIVIAAPVILTSLPLARMSVVLLIIQLFLLPIIRLLPLYEECSARLVYFFSAFYALDGIIGLVEVDPLLSREMNACLFTGGLIVLVWWGRPLALRSPGTSASFTRGQSLVVRASTVIMAIILVTNVFGFMLLSNLLRTSAVICSYLGVILYTLVRVLSSLTAAAFRSKRMQSLAVTRLHGPAVLKWTSRILMAGAFFCWTYVTLDLFALKDEASKLLETILNARIGVKTLSLSLGDIFGFVCILTIGYFISAAIRFIVREEVLSHLSLPRGVPEMLSTSVYYVLLLVVFLMSLSAAGVQLNKLTVLTGAFGVGVGFGLQNVVNNFVSGLILQFERPIRLGDVLEMGTVSGEVRHIGIRASTIRTFQGADVIIPNSAFISSQVINWTRTQTRRRVDITLGVSYGSDPNSVIGILTTVAVNHPEVLRDPPPVALFQTFGPSALEFLLMFWADQTISSRLKSELSIAVNTALRQAGFEIPIPQRDVRLRFVESGIKAAGGQGS